MASNGHNGKTNGHSVHHEAFKAALREGLDAALDIAAPASPPGIVRCDTCNALTAYREGGTDYYKVHFPQTAVRDPKTGRVVPPCPRSWPPQKPAAPAAKAP